MTHMDYTEDARNRLWTHRLHEDIILYQRHSYVLVTESLLLIACAQLLTAHWHFAASALAVVGILVTCVWLMVNFRQRQIIEHLQQRAIEFLPEFADTYQGRSEGWFSSTKVLATWIPILLGVIWTVLLAVAIT